MVTTLLARRAQFHQGRLSSYTTNYDHVFRDQAGALSQQLVHSGTSPADARNQAHGMIYQSMQNQSQLLSYMDAYKVLAIGAGIMFFLSFVMRRNDPSGGGDVAVG